MRPIEWHIGERFGKLIVVAPAGFAPIPNGRRRPLVLTRCDCGNEKITRIVSMQAGHTTSCGCVALAQVISLKASHGDAGKYDRAPEYSVWSVMKSRCLVPTDKAFHNYGGRGITVCDRWVNGDGARGGYECFIDDMGYRPSPRLTLDRRNNDGPYSPENCRWATYKQQFRNMRKNVNVTIDGETLILVDACKKYGVKYTTAHGRIRRGATPEQAVLGGSQ